MRGKLWKAVAPALALPLALVLALALARTPSPAGEVQEPAPEAAEREPLEPMVLDAGGVAVRVVPIADGLVWPWDLAFLPGEDAMLVTEGPGRLRILRGGELLPEPAWVAPSPEGNDVLHGVVAHPRFAENRLVYVSYVVGGWRGRTLAIARGRLAGDRLVEVERIFTADAWAKKTHNTAGRMLFGPDGLLYVSVGDRDPLWRTDDDSQRLRAQDPGDHVGALLRLTEDGGVPDDNPLVGRRDAKPEVFAYGFRNGYGLAFHPETGELWQADIGPMGGDEINVIRPGGNYGWPRVSTGRSYSGEPINAPSPAGVEELEAPVLDWTPAITPSSIAFYTGGRFASWHGSLFVSALSGRQIQRIAFDARGAVERREPLLTDLGLRFRRVAQGPDGLLYVATEKKYGTGEPDGAIYRIEPR